MSRLILASLVAFSWPAFAGSVGGTGLGSIAKDGELEMIVRGQDLSFDELNNARVDPSAFSRVIGASLARRPIVLNGKMMQPLDFDFQKRELTLQSVDDLSKVITITQDLD